MALSGNILPNFTGFRLDVAVFSNIPKDLARFGMVGKYSPTLEQISKDLEMFGNTWQDLDRFPTT